MNRKEWAECVAMLKGAFRTSFDLDDTAMEVWYRMLHDLPGERVQAAIVHLVRKTRAFPSIAEIVDYCHPVADAGAAWGEVLREIGRIGWYPQLVNGEMVPPQPQFSDPATYDAIKSLGGWQHVCQNMLTEDNGTWSAQFRRAYEGARDTADRAATFNRLGVSTPTHEIKPGEPRRMLGGG